MIESTPERRRRYREYWRSMDAYHKEYWKARNEHDRIVNAITLGAVLSGRRRGYQYPTFNPPPSPPFPEDLQGLQCGAKTRAGTPCKRIDLHGNGRCKFHGGMSTGPKSKKGKRRSARNGFKKGWRDTKSTETSQNLILPTIQSP